MRIRKKVSWMVLGDCSRNSTVTAVEDTTVTAVEDTTVTAVEDTTFCLLINSPPAPSSLCQPAQSPYH